MATSKKTPKTAKEKLLQHIIVLGVMVGVMWGIELIDAITSLHLDSNGIRPRTVGGLLGIAFAPILHGDMAHLVANTFPFVFLGFFLMLRGMDEFVKVTLVTIIVGGLMVWLMGRSANHIGASGLIFGYFGFLIATGFFQRSFKSIAVAVLVGLMYGGMIFGIFPGQSFVSWEGHLFGFLAGVGYSALTYRNKKGKTDKKAA